MLIGRGTTVLGEASMRWAITFSRRVWAVVVERNGIALDTRFVPPSAAAPSTNMCLYFLVRGEWIVHGGARFVGPTAFVLSEVDLEGAGKKRSLTFRAEGKPFAAIELHVRGDDLTTTPDATPRELELDAAAWKIAQTVVGLAHHDDETLTRAVNSLLTDLARLGHVYADLPESAARPMPRPFARLWNAVRPMVEGLYLSPTLQQLSTVAGTSEKQIDRNVKSFVSAFGLMGVGWRPVTRHLRLKLSVMLLSAEGVPIAEVARVVGYGSVDAMARAFRDAGLGTPTMVRDQLGANLPP